MGTSTLGVVASRRKSDSVPMAANSHTTTPRLTPNIFGITFGLAGLAQVWATSADLGTGPATVGDVLWIVAALALALLIPVYLRNVVVGGGRAMTELLDPLFAAFIPLPPIVTMLLGVALTGRARNAGLIIFAIGLVVTVLLGGWLVGQWILSDITLAQVHPGYFLPTVAGGYLAASSSAVLGYDSLARMMFGYGTVSWLVLGSILLTRLFTAPPLPAALLPTMAIQVAPPVVAGTAWFDINGGKIDTVALGLAGYAVLMVLVQVGLISAYRTAPFGPGWWSFAFSYAAVSVDAPHWLHAEHASHATVWAYVLVAVPTVAIALLAGRTAASIARGTFLSSPSPTLTGSRP